MCMLHSFESGILLIVMICVNSVVVPVMAYSRSGYPSVRYLSLVYPITGYPEHAGYQIF